MTRPLLVLGLGALFVGCDLKETGEDTYIPTDDTTETGGTTTEVYNVAYDCSSENEKWTYEVRLIGWGSGVTLDIIETGDTKSKEQWAEAHELDQGDYDPDGAWDEYDKELPMVYDWTDQVDSLNTLFTCDMEDGMTWMVSAFDMDGYFSDCTVWGHDISVFAKYLCWESTF